MIWIILLGLIAGYREVQILCDRGSWNYLNFRKWFWWTQWDGKWKLWDSFHVSNGVYALVLCISLATCTSTFHFCSDSQALNIILQILILWFIYMYTRNLMMHVIMPYKPRLWYLVPLFGGYLDKKF